MCCLVLSSFLVLRSQGQKKVLVLIAREVNFQLSFFLKDPDKDGQFIILQAKYNSKPLTPCNVSAPNYDFSKIPYTFISCIIRIEHHSYNWEAIQMVSDPITRDHFDWVLHDSTGCVHNGAQY